MGRPSKKAKAETEMKNKAVAVIENEGAAEDAIGVESAIETETEIEADAAIAEEAPTETFAFGDYTFEYFTKPNGLTRPVLKYKSEILFSGWLCKDRDSAKSLVIAIYYQLSGTLKGSTAIIRAEMLATHPLSALIYPEDNTKTLEEAIEEEGNRTDLFRVVVNQSGLALSGNTRLTVLERKALRTGVDQPVHVTITDGKDDIAVLIGGNRQREKTPQEYANEAFTLTKAKQASSNGGDKFWTDVRKTYQEISGKSAGHFDSTRAVMKFVNANKGSDIAGKVDKITEQNPTVAHEIVKIAAASRAKDGSELPPEQAAKQVAAEINKQARIKSAKPIEVENVYPGIDLDIAEIRIHYTGETVPVMAEFLSKCTPQMRARIIEAKRGGDKQKLSILKGQFEAADTKAANEASPDWNAQNDADDAVAAPIPEVDPNKPYYTKMRQHGIPEDYTWVLNKVTASALNAAVGGRADVDPFAEPTGNLDVDRRILATEFPISMEDWGGGTHDSGEGLRVVTSLPPSDALIPTFTTMMERIDNGTIAETCFIAEANVLFIPRFAPFFKAIPFAYVVVARENSREATEGFGFEPSPYMLSNPRYKHKTADDWNEAARAYVILYYGTEYARFEEACGKFGLIGYNPKAAAKKALHFDWQLEGDIEVATNAGVQYSVQKIADTYFLSVDGVRKTDRYKEVDHARRAAVIESLGL